MRQAIGVMAQAPLPGRCKTELLAAHGAEWVAGLCSAMLRDTLDGLQSVTAADYFVFLAPVARLPGEDTDDDALAQLAVDVLRRHVPAPWELVAQTGADQGALVEHAFTTMFARGATYALVAAGDAPSVPTEPIAEAVANATRATAGGEVLIGPSEDGGYYVIGMSQNEPRLMRDIPWSTPAILDTTRLRCREAGLSIRELPKWYGVREPSDVLKLLDEVRKHPERAPRTAQFLVMQA